MKFHEISTKFGQASFSTNRHENYKNKWRFFLKDGDKFNRIRDEKLLNFWGWRGAKECLRAFHRFPSIAEISYFESVRFTLAQTGQCAPHHRSSFIIFFSLCSLHSHFFHPFPPGLAESEGFFVVFRLDSKVQKMQNYVKIIESCRSRQEFSNEYLLFKNRRRYSRERVLSSLPTVS